MSNHDHQDKNLKEENYRLKYEIEAMHRIQAVIEFKMDGTILTANKRFLDIFGYRLEEIQGQHHRMFAEYEFSESYEYKDFWDRLNRGEVISDEFHRVGKGGKEIWIQGLYIPIKDQSGHYIKVIKYASNITEQKIEAFENFRVKTALDYSTANMMLADNDMQIVYISNTLLALLRKNENAIKREVPQFNVDTLIGTNASIFHKNPDHQKGIVGKLTNVHEGKIRVAGIDFNLYLTPLRDKNGNRIGTSIEWSDITQKLKDDFRREEATNLIAEQSKVLACMAEGDLRSEILSEFKEPEHAKVKEALNKALSGMNNVLHETTKVVEQVKTSVESVRATSEDVAAATVQQSSAVEEVSSSLNETDSQIKSNAENSTAANQLVAVTAETAHQGQQKMQSMLTSMNSISDSSKEISKIIKVIDDIAFQTNLLALNAAVEAARAGKHGKGFAVVAQEVRNLAGRSAKAAKETSELIEDSSSKVSEGVETANATAESLGSIVENVVKVKDLISEIATASAEQAKGITQINSAIAQINSGVQLSTTKTSSMSEESNAMSSLVTKLHHEVSKFLLADKNSMSDFDLSNLPEGLTAEMLVNMVKSLNDKKASHNHSPTSLGASHTPSDNLPKFNGDPRKKIPLDKDERDFGAF